MEARKRVVQMMALVALTVAPPASAEVDEGLGTWEGTGTSVSVDGKSSDTFTVKLIRKSAGPNVIEVDGAVTSKSGQVIPMKQRITSSKDTYRLETPTGNGGGRCFQNRLCQSYHEESPGKGWATTLVLDEPGKIRVLVTELHQGKAVRFMSQALTRTAPQ